MRPAGSPPRTRPGVGYIIAAGIPTFLLFLCFGGGALPLVMFWLIVCAACRTRAAAIIRAVPPPRRYR